MPQSSSSWKFILIASLWSAALYWFSFPPVSLPWFVWIAPWGWLAIAARPESPGKVGYLLIGLTATLLWACMLQGIRLAHWANYFGLIPLATYLGLYPVLFVATLRVAVHRTRVAMWLAAPCAWVGWELIRSYAFSGFSVGMLGHALVESHRILQIADICGAYGVAGLIVLVSAASWPIAARLLRRSTTSSHGFTPSSERLGLAIAVAAILASLGYGHYRLHELPPLTAPNDRFRIALIQGSIDTTLEIDEKARRDSFEHYRQLTLRACRAHPDLDMIVWPESAFAGDLPERLVADDAAVPQGVQLSPEEFLRAARAAASSFGEKVAYYADEFRRAAGGKNNRDHAFEFIVGTATIEFQRDRIHSYNSALHFNSDGKIVDRYYKMHPVPFGEYVPLGDRFPWLYRLTPLGGGLTPGKAPAVFTIRDWKFAPSVCFESTVPHLIRRQVADLARQGRAPDVLVNVTDDGWFRGSSILDMHLSCGVFRAVENRRPFVVAANTGFSAVVDGCGRMLTRGPRRAPEIVLGQLSKDGRSSLFVWWGDWPATICAVWVTWLLLSSWRNRKSTSSFPS